MRKATVRTLSRREFATGLTGLLGLLLGGCTPVRALLHWYPSEYDRDPDLIESSLKAFVETVIPGAPAEDPNLTRIFSDPDYPFQAHRGLFVFDLSSRSQELSGEPRFYRLSPEERTRVVQHALASEDSLVKRLYRGAIFAAQASIYGGIYGRGDCSLIDFPGPNRGYPPEVTFHPAADAVRALELTGSGNLE